ncbi:YkvA family protein [Fervidobacterium islandicum]|uniref:YkvA family protein n=1 Tax=Fervidobacterium islandicum TaxID=2423 RepID=UPI003A6996D6
MSKVITGSFDDNYNDIVKRGSSNVNMRDVGKVVEDGEKIKDKAKKHLGATLFKKIVTLWEMVRDFSTGKYKNVSFATIATITFALIYFLSPADLIPDIIPGIGYVDDITVLGFVFESLENEINRYLRWKKKQA